MLKRVASPLLVAAFIFVLAACTTTGTGTPTAEPGAGVTAEATTETGTGTDAGTTTPEATDEATSEATTEATAEATSEVTSTEEITGTGEVTGTGEITGTDGMTGTEEITGTQGMTGTSDYTGMGTVNLASSADMGSYLVDAEGMTLYTFEGEDPSTIDTTMWLPVEAGDDDFTGAGLDESLLGTVEAEDGTQQVTYNDLPLYRFVGDLLPGDVLGQGQDQAWWMVDAEGEVISEGD